MRWSSRRAPAWPTGWAGLVDRCGRRYGLTAVDDIARQLAGSALIRVHHVLRGRGERHTLFGLPAKRDTRRLRRGAGGGRPARCRDASPHRHILPGILAPCVQRGRSAAAAPRRGARLAIHRCGWVAGQGAPVRLTRPATAPARPGQQRPILSSLPDHRRRAAIAVATMLLNSSPLMKRRGGLSAIWRETALHCVPRRGCVRQHVAPSGRKVDGRARWHQARYDEAISAYLLPINLQLTEGALASRHVTGWLRRRAG